MNVLRNSKGHPWQLQLHASTAGEQGFALALLEWSRNPRLHKIMKEHLWRMLLLGSHGELHANDPCRAHALVQPFRILTPNVTISQL